MTIKAITFDFWQTLYHSTGVDYNERARQLKLKIEQAAGTGIEQQKFDLAVKIARDTWNRTWVQDHKTLTASEWLTIALQYLDLSIQPEQFLDIQLWMENRVLGDAPTLVSGARAVLDNLSSRYKLGIISDTGLTPGRVLRQVLEADNLTGYFTHLTFSDELGRSKPHPNAFLTTLQALGAEPIQAVHIGDLLRTDIAGAKNVGMRGIQFIGLNHDTANAQDVAPDAVIRHHTELESLLRQWNGAI